MPAPVYRNNITQLTERAAAAFLAGADAALTNFVPAEIFTGITLAELAAKRVVCYCPEATHDTQFEGNWLCKLRIEVYSPLDEAGADELHYQRAGEVFSKFMTATGPADLSAALAFTGYTAQIVIPTRQGWGIEKERRAWVSWLELDVNCCATDLV